MDSARELILDATSKLVELRRLPEWRRQLPERCTPVPWFGHAKSPKRRVLTLGANPSRREFLDASRHETDLAALTGEHQHLRYLAVPRLRVLRDDEQLEDLQRSESLQLQAVAALNAYFCTNPYTQWFGTNAADGYRVEGFLQGFGASLYGRELASLAAIHIDLFPFATLSDFREIRGQAEVSLFKNGWATSFLRRLVRALAPEAVVVCGRSNWNCYCEHVDPDAESGSQFGSYGGAHYWIREDGSLAVPVVGVSTNLGNPRGFDGPSLRGFGAEVRRALRLA